MLYPPLTKTAETVLKKRYLADGEDWEGLCLRVSRNVAGAEAPANREKWERMFYALLEPRIFLPNSPTLMNAGRRLQQLSACFVLPVEDSLADIYGTLTRAALVHQSGGGTGFSFSRLRPAGDLVGSTGGIASGPCSFIDVYDAATNAVKQGGTRRGANMAILNVHHPDILEFIRAKRDMRRWTNFNVSVGITEAFMSALRDKEAYRLYNPRLLQPAGELSAGYVWGEIVKCAWETGDPGLVFLDHINGRHWNQHLGEISSTNPCGEQPLLPNEACNLGSIDLYKVIGDRMPDTEYWERSLAPVVNIAVRFLDDVISVNKYPDAAIQEAVLATRRIGLGVMGWADCLSAWDVPYDSPNALDCAVELSHILCSLTVKASEKLGQEKGFYPAHPPHILTRNTAPNTIAPTGTIGIISGSSTGIEPIYKLAYTRNVLDGARLTELHPVFEARGRAEEWLTPALVKRLLRDDYSRVPDHILDVFPTAAEIDPMTHLNMQAAWQSSIDNAVSKTINLPEDATVDDIEQIYHRAYELELMGITVYRDKSRPTQVFTAPTEELCPECFSVLTMKEGCWQCPKCHYSVCNL